MHSRSRGHTAVLLGLLSLFAALLCIAAEKRASRRIARKGREGGGARPRTEVADQDERREWNKLDEALEESFPASDPPAY